MKKKGLGLCLVIAPIIGLFLILWAYTIITSSDFVQNDRTWIRYPIHAFIAWHIRRMPFNRTRDGSGSEMTRVSQKNIAPTDLTDWKTYKNENYGFEIKYPPDWSYNSPGLMGVVEFCDPDGLADPKKPELGCEIRERTNMMSDTPRSTASIFLFVDVKNSKNCIQKKVENEVEILDCAGQVYWKKGGHLFFLETEYGFTSSPENKRIFEGMLSTFRFWIPTF